MQKKGGVVQSKGGRVVVGAVIQVYLAGTNTPATIFADKAGTEPITQLVTDNEGEFAFYAPNGRYDIKTVINGRVDGQSADELLFDPSDVVDDSATRLDALDAQVESVSDSIVTLNSSNSGLNGRVEVLESMTQDFDSAHGTSIVFGTWPDGSTAPVSSLGEEEGAAKIGYGSSTVGQTLDTIAGNSGANNVGFIQSGTEAAGRKVQDKLRDVVSVRDFGVKGDATDEYAGIKKAWDYCLSTGKNLYFPPGVYSSGVKNMPFKHPDYPATDLLDCGNITIYGDGPATVLRSDSAVGADVINVYSCQNLHFRDFAVTASLSGSTGAGSNGVSIVGGFDHVTFDNIWCNNLPYVDKGTHLDGGKALTIQPGTPATKCGQLKASRIYAKGCVFGFSLEVDVSHWSSKTHAIDVDLYAEDCHIGVVFSGAEPSGAMRAGLSTGLRVRAHLVNCQRNVFVGRGHGLDIEAGIVTTKSAAARRLNPLGSTWNSADTVVDGLSCSYAKDSRLTIYGDIGECDYKVQIGGSSTGSSGVNGATEASDFYLDLGGQANTSPFNALSSGGNTVANCRLYFAPDFGVTLGVLPSGLTATSAQNTVTIGPSQRAISLLVAGDINLAAANGVSVFQKINVGNSGLRMDFSSSASSATDNINYGFLKHDGTLVAGFRNDGAIVTQGRATATAVATVKQVMPIYDNTGALVGYVPIYTSYT